MAVPAVRALAAATLLLAPLLAGCLADADDEPILPGGSGVSKGPPPEDRDQPSGNGTAEAVGTLRVLVLTPDLDPVEGARVVAGPYEQTTRSDGRADFVDIPVGRYDVTAERDDWGSSHSNVEVTEGTTDIDLKLFPDEGRGPPLVDTTYTREYEYSGVFECSATYLIITGDCLLIIDFVVNETLGLPIHVGNTTDEENTFEFPLDAGWERVHGEMHFDDSVTLIGDGMSLAFEPAACPEGGHASKYARANGTSPLIVDMYKGVRHENYTYNEECDHGESPNPLGGEVIRVRAFVLGLMHNPGGSGFLGIGAAYGHQFDIYVTVFYGDPGPGDYRFPLPE